MLVGQGAIVRTAREADLDGPYGLIASVRIVGAPCLTVGEGSVRMGQAVSRERRVD
jgi:hypothetical protein